MIKKKMILCILILLLIGTLSATAVVNLGESESQGSTLKMQEKPTIINYSLVNTNHSYTTDCWITTEGVKCDVSDITYDEISGGDVNALGYTGYFNFIQGVVGQLSIDGDPWYLGGVDLELAQNLLVRGNLSVNENFNVSGNSNFGGNLTPDTTLTQNIGSGANRWNWLYVRNISVEDIDAFNIYVSGNITASNLNVENITTDDIYSLSGNGINIWDNTTLNNNTLTAKTFISNQGFPVVIEGMDIPVAGYQRLVFKPITPNTRLYVNLYPNGTATETAFIVNSVPFGEDGSKLSFGVEGAKAYITTGLSGAGVESTLNISSNNPIYLTAPIVNITNTLGAKDAFIKNNLNAGGTGTFNVLSATTGNLIGGLSFASNYIGKTGATQLLYFDAGNISSLTLLNISQGAIARKGINITASNLSTMLDNTYYTKTGDAGGIIAHYHNIIINGGIGIYYRITSDAFTNQMLLALSSTNAVWRSDSDLTFSTKAGTATYIKFQPATPTVQFVLSNANFSDNYGISLGTGNDAFDYWDGNNRIFEYNRTNPDSIAWFSGNTSAISYFQRSPHDLDYQGDYLSLLKTPTEMLDASTGKLKKEVLAPSEIGQGKVTNKSSCQEVFDYYEYCFNDVCMPEFEQEYNKGDKEIIRKEVYRKECETTIIEMTDVGGMAMVNKLQLSELLKYVKQLEERIDVLRQELYEIKTETCEKEPSYSWCK